VTETIAPDAAEADSAEPFRRVQYELRDGVMAGIAFGDARRTPDIVFLHATGLNARAYRALLAPLGERLHAVALDFRGHGRSTLPAQRFGYASWRRHRNDVIALLDKHFDKPVTLAGHSMGGTVSLLAAGKRPDLVNGLVLVDPVILPPPAYVLMALPGAALLSRSFMPIARKAADRRRRFPNRAAAVKAFSGRGFFKTFPPEMLEDYVADGLVDTPSGQVKLACSPSYEAATFAAQGHDPWHAAKRAPGPIVILRAEHRSTLPQAAAQHFGALRPDARIAVVEGSSHALPMERPDRVRAAIESATLMASQANRDLDLDLT
jgi:pimeloyl-ACP methyl ester carboxylesterase